VQPLRSCEQFRSFLTTSDLSRRFGVNFTWSDAPFVSPAGRWLCTICTLQWWNLLETPISYNSFIKIFRKHAMHSREVWIFLSTRQGHARKENAVVGRQKDCHVKTLSAQLAVEVTNSYLDILPYDVEQISQTAARTTSSVP